MTPPGVIEYYMVVMARRLSTRITAALVAPWLAFVLAEPVPMHECAVHGIHASGSHGAGSRAAGAHTAASHAGAGVAHGMDAGMQMPVAQGDHGAQPEGSPDSSGGHRHCSCLGGCCAAAPVTLVGAPELAFAPEQVRAETSVARSAEFAPASAEHVLPFANGPPVARA